MGRSMTSGAAVFTVGGHVVVASLLKEQSFFLAVGRGSEDWDSVMVPPSPADTDLVDKVGVTRLRQIEFATPDDAGEISMLDGSKFAISAEPTRYLYLTFKLDLADASPNTLRECGVYAGTELAEGIPSGQFYIPAEDVVSYGVPINIDRFNSIVRDGASEQAFSSILAL